MKKKVYVLCVISGAPALTSRNFKEKDFEQVVEFIHRAVEIALQAKSKSGMLIHFLIIAFFHLKILCKSIQNTFFLLLN